MRILFSYYPLYVSWNHGVALLTSICNASGIEASYIPCTDDEFASKINEVQFVGFSFVTEYDYAASYPWIKMAREANKIVLAGGIYPRRNGILDKSLFDFICRGDGETIPEFLIDFKTGVFDETRLQDNLDTLPMPDLSPLTGYEFHRGMPFLEGLKIFPYGTSRGCPYQCAFCEVQYQPKRVIIKHTIEENISDLQRLYAPDLFYILDELPPYYLESWREQWKNINVPFMAYIRCDIEPNHLEFLINHGLKVVAFGIETGNETFRNTVLKKNVTNDDIYRTIKILTRNNIKYIPFYMTNLPHETDSLQRETFYMIERLGGYPICWDYLDLNGSRKAA